jgi:hypothetical protein
MATRPKMLTNFAAIIAGLTLAPFPTAAQTPSYAQPTSPNSEQVINGHIASIVGKYEITVRDERGYLDDVHLHQGTIINPTGLTLEPGMRATIVGYNAGKWFEANEIDTPYHYLPVPVPVYYGPGWWYPGLPYGYGPSFSLVVGGGHVARRPFIHTVAPPPPHIPPALHEPFVGRR